MMDFLNDIAMRIDTLIKPHMTSPNQTVATMTVLLIVASTIFAFVTYQYIHFFSGNPSDKSSIGLDVSTGLKNEMKGNQDNVQANQADDRVLNPAVFKKFTILQIKQVSYNTKLFRFEIPHGKSLDLPLGRHISLKVDIDGNRVIRAYTPTTSSNQKGYFDLLIKSYDLGKLSPYLHTLKTGASVEIRGPVGRFNYIKNSFSAIGLIAGGTGITPCLQVLRCILDQGISGYEDDQTSFILFYQNRKEEDILLRTDLDQMQLKYQHRLKVIYFLSNPSSANWSQGNQKKGYIGAADISENMSSEKAQLVCLCGPSGFNTTIKDMLLSEGGHTESSVYIW